MRGLIHLDPASYSETRLVKTLWRPRNSPEVVSDIPRERDDYEEGDGLPPEIEEHLLRAAFDDSSIGIALIEVGEDLRPERVVRVNPALAAVTGLSEEELIGSGTSILGLQSWSRDSEMARDTGSGAENVEFERSFERPDGSRMWILVTLSPIVEDPLAPGRYRLAQVQDISDRRDYQSRLQFLAQHDPLTGLVNTRHLYEIVDQGIAYQTRYGGNASLISFDLDHFKLINDTCGHAGGDEALRVFGAILVERTRETDTVARLGGDEFVIFLPSTDASGAISIAERVLEHLRTHPLEIDPEGVGSVHLSSSGGVTELGGREGVSARDLLAEADSALYAAKKGGRDRVVEFGLGEDPVIKQSLRLTWVERTRRALENDGLFLEAQPILDRETGEVVRREALLRMDDPDAGIVYPPTFLYTAERFGLSSEIDNWVLDSVITALAASPDKESRVSVNLTAASFDFTSDLPERLPNSLKQAGVDPGRLDFELTEATCVTNIERARIFMEKMNQIGCKVALDDFGSGFGGFYYLKMLPIDILKIGGELIRSVTTSEEDRLIVKAISEMATGLGLEVVAEYVIDQETADACSGLGIHLCQGSFAGPTVPIGEALGID